MKKKIIGLLAIAVLTFSLTSCAIDNNTKNAINEEQVDDAVESSTRPLIIEMVGETDPIGVYEGTVTITGSGIDDICYEGIIMIQMDGDKIRVTSTDSIRSNFNDLF